MPLKPTLPSDITPFSERVAAAAAARAAITLPPMSFEALYEEVLKIAATEGSMHARVWEEGWRSTHPSKLIVTKFNGRRWEEVLIYVFKTGNEASNFVSHVYDRQPTNALLKQICVGIQ